MTSTFATLFSLTLFITVASCARVQRPDKIDLSEQIIGSNMNHNNGPFQICIKKAGIPDYLRFVALDNLPAGQTLDGETLRKAPYFTAPGNAPEEGSENFEQASADYELKKKASTRFSYCKFGINEIAKIDNMRIINISIGEAKGLALAATGQDGWCKYVYDIADKDVAADLPEDDPNHVVFNHFLAPLISNAPNCQLSNDGPKGQTVLKTDFVKAERLVI